MAHDVTQYAPYNPTFVMKVEETQGNQAVISLEPLDQGYGHTLGNALRRVLLSSLPGMAITTVKIEGIDHQYSTLEGMSEDVVELILNLKQVRVKSTGATEGTLRLKISGPADVTAADITGDGAVSVVNSDVHIAHLAKGKTLDIEMKAEAGMGYVMATDRKTSTVGEIPVDSLFSPVIKVNYKVESTRVGRRTDYDRLLLEVHTDGSSSPEEAVTQAAQILARQFTQVFNPVVPAEAEVPSYVTPEEAEVLKLTVEELDLPTRIANALRKGGFKTVGDLVGAPRIVVAKVKNLGEKSVDVINEALMKKGVTLGE